MTTKDEALKLALEALEEIESYYGYDRSVGAMASSMYEASNLAKITSTRIRSALAEHSTNRPTSRLDAYPKEQVAAAKKDVLSAVERHGLAEQPAQGETK